MSDEALTGLGSRDPDDLAVVVCAALRVAGVDAKVRFKRSASGAVVAIEVVEGHTLVASIPTFPVHLPEVLAEGIELMADVLAERLKTLGVHR